MFTPTYLLLGQGAKDCTKMPSQCVGERFATILGDKHHMRLAVPLGMAESLAVGFDHRVGHSWPLSMMSESSNTSVLRCVVFVPFQKEFLVYEL